MAAVEREHRSIVAGGTGGRLDRPRRSPAAALARRVLPDTLAAALVAAAVYAFFGHAFLNYDSTYALVWGDQIAGGESPDYEVPVAPTPHPLAIAVGVVLAPLGDGAEDVFLALVVLAMGALAVGLFRLGKELYAWPVGLLAAAILVTRVPPLNFGIRGYVDLPALALVVWAALLEARRPRSGAPVLVLLGLAGLLRPEAWLLAAAYWLWLALPALAGRVGGQGGKAQLVRGALAATPPGWRARLVRAAVPPGPRRWAALLGVAAVFAGPRRGARELAGLAALAAAAPLLWALSDLAATGDPLWSLNGTSELAAELGRPTGLGAVPELLPRRLGEIVRLPELIAAVLGAAAGLWWLRARTALPLALAVLNGIAYVVFALGGLPLLGRYLFLAAAMLSLLAALAVFGWRTLPAGHPDRARWRIAGAVVLLAILVFVPVQADRLGDLRGEIADRDRVQADLHALVERPRAEQALSRCGTVFVPNHRPVPALALWTERKPSVIVSAQRRTPSDNGVFLAPRPEVAHLSILDPKDDTLPAEAVPAGYRLVEDNRSWRLFVGPACG